MTENENVKYEKVDQNLKDVKGNMEEMSNQVVLFILVILEFFVLSCFFLKGYIYERIDQ